MGDTMSGIWLPGGAVILSIFLVVIFFVKGSVKNKETKIYSTLIILNLLYSILGAGIYIYAMSIGNLYITGVIQSFYLVVMDLMLYFMLRYVIELNNFSLKLKSLAKLVFSIFTIITILFILALPMDTIIKGESVDLNGPAYYAAMVEVVLYMILIILFCLSYFIKQRKGISKIVPYISLFIMFIFGLLLRVYYPEIITETFIFAFYFLIMYFTIENPDVKMIRDLEMAKDTAEKANRAKSDFLSSMSHEIRTPLNAIVGLSEDITLYKDQVPKEVYEDSIDIQNASHTLLEIVGNILDINKIESDKMELIIQKNTEVGIKSIVPVIMERTVVKLDEKIASKKLERWQKIAEIAAKQSMRDIIPQIGNITKLKDIDTTEFDAVLVAYENEEHNMLKTELQKLERKIKSNNSSEQQYNIAIVIGPEGGISEKELVMLAEKNAKFVSLGKRILRTETAGVVMAGNIIYELEYNS